MKLFPTRRHAKRHPVRSAALAVILCFCAGCGADRAVMNRSYNSEVVQLYCVDAELYRLIPYDVELKTHSAQDSARQVVDKLVFGMDYEKIKHTIPQIKNGVTVSVKGDMAYVDFSQEMIDAHPSDIDSEYLTVYSIVNSLMSVDGINAVKFTMAGEEKADFKGYLDMRETFIPDYNV